MRRCPCHRNIGYSTWRTIDGRMTGAFTADRHHVTCDACGRWLPLGPSNDEPEAVRVEIRAAEIAQRGTESGRYVDMGTSDWYGWIAACPGYEHVDRIDASELAGYLAHYIATHSEES